MEFGEKLKIFRKNKGLTQEEFAKAIFVSRTAVSKWESGKGYPNIDLLKVVADFFSVSIDELLSSEKILSIAKKENNTNIIRVCNFLFGFMDILAVLLLVLPLYPQKISGHIYSVSLFEFTSILRATLILHWVLYILLICLGLVKVVLSCLKISKNQKLISLFSLFISSILVVFLSITREPYPLIMVFVLLVIKAILTIRQFNKNL